MGEGLEDEGMGGFRTGFAWIRARGLTPPVRGSEPRKPAARRSRQGSGSRQVTSMWLPGKMLVKHLPSAEHHPESRLSSRGGDQDTRGDGGGLNSDLQRSGPAELANKKPETVRVRSAQPVLNALKELAALSRVLK